MNDVFRRLAIAALITAAAHASADGQTVTLRTAGPGPGPRILRGALAAPHLLVTPASGQSDLPKDTVYSTTVIIVGHDATVASTVHGDVIVVGGDLFLHPGAHIDGRAVAFGGAVYNSSLAMAGGNRLSYRDFTYDITAVPGGYALDYRWVRERTVDHFAFPLLGFGLPTYDRSSGLAMSWGPTITLDTGAIVFRPRGRYRSQLGRVDAWADLIAEPWRRFRFEARGGRGTFTNDAWIYGDMVNTASSFFLGEDTRNYFRADRGEFTAHYTFEGATASITPYLGGRQERDWSVRPGIDAEGGPWSLFGRRSRDDMLRPNPPVIARSITSVLGGATFAYESQGLRMDFDVDGEVGLATSGRPSFGQTTINGSVRFTTFGAQRYWLDAHAVLSGGTTPPQRFAYVGGTGTIPIMDLLEQGGDQLLFVDSRYEIPIDAFNLPFGGPPTVTLRWVVGGAGVESLPSLEQRIGVRLAVSLLRLQFIVDPFTSRSHFGVSLAVGR